MTTKTAERSRPTDLELMLYADGELEGERLAAVEARLAQDPGTRNKLLGLGAVGGLLREQALTSTASADDLADRIMASIEAEPARVAPRLPSNVVPMAGRARRLVTHRLINSNPRAGLLAVAAVAVAAAAGLLFWGRTVPPADSPVAGLEAPAPLTVQAPLEPEGDVRHGVEVAAVDFGARTGAVFYVPTGLSASSTTTVVWLSDDALGGNE